MKGWEMMMKEMAHKVAPEAGPYTSEAFVGACMAMEVEETGDEGGAAYGSGCGVGGL